MDAESLFETYAATKVTVVSGDLVSNQASWLDQEVYPSLEAASRAARDDARHAGKVMQMILHLPGNLDRPLTTDEIREVLKPRREYHNAVRTGLRLARDRIEPLANQLTSIVIEFNNDGRLGSPRHLEAMRKVCTGTLREAGEVIVRTLIARKGDNAGNRREELASAIGELIPPIQREFDAHDGTPLLSKPIEERAALDVELARIVSRILLDFDEGVYHMAEEPERGGNIHIGRIDQMAGHIGFGNSGNVRAEQTMNQAALFQSLSSALQSAIADKAELEKLLALVQRMDQQRTVPALFAAAYGEFIAAAANHMQIVAPFLPALLPFLGGGV
ncbi:MAG: hypothetical protein JWQ89_2231 [Devosia sp.]|uniref:hypothetical protein n=1 Tax=Devosia sp. TaxID=1871048 RepID=UPI002633219E|nr:hypothetical protein [Devosia sp.]MDB5540504.1 hypothetical protein [Devosia sp.]